MLPSATAAASNSPKQKNLAVWIHSTLTGWWYNANMMSGWMKSKAENISLSGYSEMLLYVFKTHTISVGYLVFSSVEDTEDEWID